MAALDGPMAELTALLIGDLIDHLSTQRGTARQRRAVQEVLDRGAIRARAGDLAGAMDLFREAVRKDPTSVPARIQLVKALKQSGRDLEALVVVGYALSLAEDGAARAILSTFAGVIAHDLFLATRDLGHARQALGFHRQALMEAPRDLLPAWNLVDTRIAAAAVDLDNREAWLAEAETAFREVVRLAGASPDPRYLPSIVADAERAVQGLGDWWAHQLDDLRGLASESRRWEAPKSPPRRTWTWRLVGLVVAIVASVALPLLVHWLAGALVGVSATAVVEHGWQMIAVVEPTWGDWGPLAQVSDW